MKYRTFLCNLSRKSEPPSTSWPPNYFIRKHLIAFCRANQKYVVSPEFRQQQILQIIGPQSTESDWFRLNSRDLCNHHIRQIRALDRRRMLHWWQWKGRYGHKTPPTPLSKPTKRSWRCWQSLSIVAFAKDKMPFRFKTISPSSEPFSKSCWGSLGCPPRIISPFLSTIQQLDA